VVTHATTAPSDIYFLSLHDALPISDITAYADYTAYVQSRRIRQRGALDHQPLGFTGLPGTLEHRQLLAVVGAHDLQLIAGLHHADLYRLADRQLNHIGEVVFALGVVVRQPGQPGLDAAARPQHDAGIALPDLALFRTGILLFDDGLHLPLGVAQDAPVAGGIAQQHGEHAEAVHRSLLDQRLEGLHRQQRHITIEHQHLIGAIDVRQGLGHRMAGAQLLALQYPVQIRRVQRLPHLLRAMADDHMDA